MIEPRYDIANDRFERLKKIAPKLNQLREDPNARVHYELMSGGLVWSDELPPWDELESGESHCMRAIWRFRSSLIEEKPDERFRAKWEKARELFPDWPGFLAERRDTKWRDMFLEQQAKLLAAWEDLDVKYEAQRTRSVGNAAVPLANGAMGKLPGTDDGQVVPQEDFHR